MSENTTECNKLHFGSIHHAALFPPVKPSSQLLERPFDKTIGDVSSWRSVSVSAAPGYGKTVLLASWYRMLGRQEDCRVSWLSVDLMFYRESDFWAHFLASLDVLWPGLQDRVLMQEGVDESPERFLLALSNEIFYFDETLDEDPYRILFIDNLDCISDPVILRYVSSIIETTPESFRMVVSGTSLSKRFFRGPYEDSNLRLSTRDLAFSLEETILFLNNVFPENEIAPSTIERLYQKTQGWPKALSISFSSYKLRGEKGLIEFDSSEESMDQFFQDYSSEYFSPSLLSFCEQASFFDCFNNEICDDVLQEWDSREEIQKLLSLNSFLFDSERKNRWFVFHPLFAEWLRTRLFRDNKIIDRIGWSSADWLNARGDFWGATRSLLLAHDLRLFSQMPTMLKGSNAYWNEKELFLYLSACPVDTNHLDPLFCIMAAWTYAFFCMPTSLKACIEALSSLPESAFDSIGTKQACSLQERCLEVRSHNLEGQFAKVFEVSEQIFNELDADPALLDPDGQLRCSMMHSAAEAYASTGRFESAIEYFHRSKAYLSDSIRLPLLAHSDYEIALIYYEKGDVKQAVKICKAALVKCPENQPIYGAFCGLLGLCQTEELDLTGALANIELAEKVLSLQLNPDMYFELEINKAHYYRACQDEAHAFEITLKLLDEMGDASYVRNIRARACALLVDIAFSLSYARDLSNAIAQLRSYLDDDNPVTLIRVQLAETKEHLIYNRPGEAIELLEKTKALCKQFDLPAFLIEAKLSEVRAWDILGEDQKALACLRDACVLASSQELFAPFLVELDPKMNAVRQLSRVHAPSALVRSFLDRLLVLFQERRDVLRSNLGDELSASAHLTSREEEILSLIIQGMKRQEIAEYLSLSPNTVKAHTANIYGKLGVSTKTELIQLRGRV